MMYTTDIRTTIKKYSLYGLVLITLLYGAFRAYPLVMGPTITLYYPSDGDTVATSSFEVSGRAVRSKEITLQGKQITIDTDGTFRETIVPLYPYTILVLTATDGYGKMITKTLRVIPQ